MKRQVAASYGTLDALVYVLGGLRHLPGRKAVFLVSDGYSAGARATSTPCANWLTLPIGLPRSSTQLVRKDCRRSRWTRAWALRRPIVNSNIGSERTAGQQARQLFRLTGPLAYLAQQTEGLFLHNNNDLAGGMHDMMDDLSGYYLIGFKPPADTFKEGKPGHEYHHIQVKVKIRGLKVRSRPGFYGIADSATPPVYRTRAEQLKAAAVSPFTTAGVRVQLAPQFLRRGKKNSVARLWLHIDARDLTFEDAPSGNKQGKADLMALAFGDNGTMTSGVQGPLKGSVQPAELEALRQRGVNFRLDLPIKKPGGYQVRVAVRDEDSQKLGSASQFIEIPDLRTDHLALSGIVLNANVLGESGPAVRRVKAGDRVSYQLEIYNARRESGTQAVDLEGKIEIYRDGRLTWAENPRRIIEGPRNSSRLVLSGDLVLAPNMLPGNYVLLVTITDKLAPPRRNANAARQWINFQVVP